MSFIDFKADFRLTFMTSSLCFVASTIGYVRHLLNSFIPVLKSSSYACGTLLVERLLGVAGRIYMRPGTTMLPMTLRLFRPQRSSDTAYIVGHSTSLARYIVIFSATLLHPIFFIVMGFRKNFPSMLVAYVISAFARALLSGLCPARPVQYMRTDLQFSDDVSDTYTRLSHRRCNPHTSSSTATSSAHQHQKER